MIGGSKRKVTGYQHEYVWHIQVVRIPQKKLHPGYVCCNSFYTIVNNPLSTISAAIKQQRQWPAAYPHQSENNSAA